MAPSATDLFPDEFEREIEPITEDECRNNFENFFHDKPGLKAMYPGGATPDHISRAVKMANEILTEMKCPSREAALYFTLLILYDLVILADDSLSMRTQQKGARIPALATTLRNVARIYQLAREEGITDVRFLNSIHKAPNMKLRMIKNMMSAHQFRGQTRIGTELKRKVLKDYVTDTMKKPLLVITITDGDIDGEPRDTLFSVIKECIDRLNEKENGADAIGFQFARVGDDEGAGKLLDMLDNHNVVGPYVDQLHKPIDGIQDVKQKWDLLPKLLLGGIVPYFDDVDADAEAPIEKLTDTYVEPEAKILTFAEDDDDDYDDM
ncbi:hypothetical protein K440DRAFT_629348 [Wilcoxina mikolae CBS 423.85]|nr:hypothetical protein K440DRAFT_629348 [Wilcoxina mikolae CBS 423.85]